MFGMLKGVDPSHLVIRVPREAYRCTYLEFSTPAYAPGRLNGVYCDSVKPSPVSLEDKVSATRRRKHK